MRSRSVLVVGLTCLAGACTTVPQYDTRDWRATLEERGDSNVRANATAASSPGQTDVSINLAGGQPGATHPWHVHIGTCADGGGIAGDPGAYPSLRPDPAGAASAMARLTVQLIPGDDYHVNVHRSPQALGDIIACGDLR
jgi:hypothetical protein